MQLLSCVSGGGYTGGALVNWWRKKAQAREQVHELVHVAICTENAYLHCDPDHVGVRFGGWTKEHSQFIRKMNLYFKLINL